MEVLFSNFQLKGNIKGFIRKSRVSPGLCLKFENSH